MEADIRLRAVAAVQGDSLRSLKDRIHFAVCGKSGGKKKVGIDDDDVVDIEEETDMFGFSMIDTYEESADSTIERMKNNRNFENPESIRLMCRSYGIEKPFDLTVNNRRGEIDLGSLPSYETIRDNQNMNWAKQRTDLALTYFAQDNHTAAIKSCCEALQFHPNVESLLVRAKVYSSAQEFQKATSDYESVLHMDPGNKVASVYLKSLKSRQRFAEGEDNLLSTEDETRIGYQGLIEKLTKSLNSSQRDNSKVEYCDIHESDCEEQSHSHSTKKRKKERKKEKKKRAKRKKEKSSKSKKSRRSSSHLSSDDSSDSDGKDSPEPSFEKKPRIQETSPSVHPILQRTKNSLWNF